MSAQTLPQGVLPNMMKRPLCPAQKIEQGVIILAEMIREMSK